MTPETLAELRRLAEAANADAVQGATYERDWPLSSRAVGRFLRALNPDLAIELLDAAAERDALAAQVEALADWHETKADKARRFPGPESRGLVMEKAAQVHSDAAWRIRILRALDEEPQP